MELTILVPRLLAAMADQGPSNSGDLATWVTGVATVLLFGATLGLIVVGSKQIRTEREKRLQQERDTTASMLRSQAELISAWIVQEG